MISAVIISTILGLCIGGLIGGRYASRDRERLRTAYDVARDELEECECENVARAEYIRQLQDRCGETNQ